MRILISVIISVTERDDWNFFTEALNSILNSIDNEDQLIISIDGPIDFFDFNLINQKLKGYDFVYSYSESFKGLGLSRNLAVAKVKHSYFAVMDADDLSRKNRFTISKELVKANKSASVFTFAIEEFEKKPGDLGRVRLSSFDKNNKGCWLRNPLNHVTVIIKKSDFLKVKGYKSFKYIEDWELFFRLWCSNFKIIKSNEVVVDVRRGKDFLQRRKGFDYFLVETNLLKKISKKIRISQFKLLLNIFLRFILRCGPSIFIKIAYLNLRLKKNIK